MGGATPSPASRAPLPQPTSRRRPNPRSRIWCSTKCCARRSPDHRYRRAHGRPLGRPAAQRICGLCGGYFRRRPPFAVGHPLDERGAGAGPRRSIWPSWPPKRWACSSRPPARAGSQSRSSRCRLAAHGEARGVIQILVNLIGNAVRHSPAGGTVTSRSSAWAPARSSCRRRGPGHRPGRPAAHFRAVRARQARRAGERARPCHLAPAGAVDGRRHRARKPARNGRALYPGAAGAPSASRRARSRAASRRRRAGAGGRSSARGRKSSRSTARPSRPSGRARTRP